MHTAERSCQSCLQGTDPFPTPPYLTREMCHLYQQSLSSMTFEWVTAVSGPGPAPFAVTSHSWPLLCVGWEMEKNSSTCFISRIVASKGLNGLGCWVFVGMCARICMYTYVCVYIYTHTLVWLQDLMPAGHSHIIIWKLDNDSTMTNPGCLQ